MLSLPIRSIIIYSKTIKIFAGVSQIISIPNTHTGRQISASLKDDGFSSNRWAY